MRKLLYIVLLLTCAAAWAAKPGAWDRRAAKNKAQLYGMVAAEAFALERYDDYFVATLRAYEMDSTDLDAASQWGMLIDNISSDSASLVKAYAAVKARYLSDPSNLPLATSLASMASKRHLFDDVIMVWQKVDSAFPTMTQPAQELANAYLIASMVGDSSNFDKAMAIYKRLEAGEGRNVGIASQKVRAYSLRKDTASIYAEVDSILAFAPQDPIVALFAGSTYNFFGDKDNAMRYFDLACRLDSTNGKAFMAKAQLYAEMGDSAAYEREVVKALNSASLEMEDKMDIFINYIRKYYADPNQEQTLRDLFANLEQMHPGTAELHALYSEYLSEIGDSVGAFDELGFAVDLDPENDKMFINYVQLSFNAGDNERTIALSHRGMEKFPDQMFYPLTIASVYQREKEYDKGIAIIDSVDAKISEVFNKYAYASLLSYKGDLQYMDHDTVGAVETYDRVLALDPGNALALNNVAYYMCLLNRDLDKAEQYSMRSIRLDDSNPTYLDTYAWIQFRKKDYQLAKQYIDMALNAYDSDTIAADSVNVDSLNLPPADIYEHAGDIYFFCGDHKQALVFWEKALALEPDNELLTRKVSQKTYFYE